MGEQSDDSVYPQNIENIGHVGMRRTVGFNLMVQDFENYDLYPVAPHKPGSRTGLLILKIAIVLP